MGRIEGRTLKINYVRTQKLMRPINTNDKTDKELEGASLSLEYEDSSTGRNECDDERTRDCVKEKSALLQIAVLLDLRRGSSKLSLYNLRQPSSLVRAATVRIDPAASQVRWAKPS